MLCVPHLLVARPTLCCTRLQLDDQAIFPQQYGVPFPQNFVDVVKVIFKRLFRVYAHIYHSHFKHVCSLGEEAHLNTCFKHFMYFAQASAVMAECRMHV